MINTGKLAGKTLFITGATRGIGKAIALKAAKDGANVCIAAKTVTPHPKLPGTIHSAAEEVEAAGGKALAFQCDIRDEESVIKAMEATANKFGGIDILINNASAISLTDTSTTTMKKYDLMNGVNTRGTFMSSKYAIPYLEKGSNPHILTLSPPLDMDPIWFQAHTGYSIAKYGMSLCVLGMSSELRDQKIAVNALWPRTSIWTSAMDMLGGEEAMKGSRKVDIMSDAAYAILTKNSSEFTGNFCIDEELLKDEGISDMAQYACSPGSPLLADFFLPKKFRGGLMSMGSYEGPNFSPKYPGVRSFCSKAGSAPGADTTKVFDTMKAKLTDDVKKDINGLLAFEISGSKWFVDAHPDRPLQVTSDVLPNKPDVTFICDEGTFVKLAKGEVKATNVFMTGKLKIKGNLSIAMKAEKIFKKLS